MLTREQQERAVDLRRAGHSYRSIAEELGGVSHETVRAVVTARLPEGDAALESVRSTVRNRRITEMREWITEHGPVPRSHVMEEYGLTSAQLAALMPELPGHLIVYDTKNRAEHYTDEQIEDSIRRAWELLKERSPEAKGLSHAVYEKVRQTDDPSSARILVRKGSWKVACKDARVPSGTRNRPRSSYVSKWDDEEILQAVADFLQEVMAEGKRPTYARYDSWQQGSDERPSGSLVRNRMVEAGLEGWADITVAAAKLIPAA